jgi:hypothetical protein
MAPARVIAQDRPRIEIDQRSDGGAVWRYAKHEGLDAQIAIEALGIELPAAEFFSDHPPE